MIIFTIIIEWYDTYINEILKTKSIDIRVLLRVIDLTGKKMR